jgi:S-adenosylmethionine:tRNA ribosyltransferase-isomerase
VHLGDFDYSLPKDLIAQYPRPTRRDARLLVVGRDPAVGADLTIADLPRLLHAGDLVVLNDTRVIPARLFGHKETGGAIEILIERVVGPQRALAHVRASKAPQRGARLLLQPSGELVVAGREDDLFLLDSPTGQDLHLLLARAGHMPLPPYIERPDEVSDAERYQTVYARAPGAVAAPTAGLHIDCDLLDEMQAMGVALAYVTLHVGAGTFRPLRSPIKDHVMHAEQIEVSQDLCAAVNGARRSGGRIVAIGTTVARALETAAQMALPLQPFSGDTRLFIQPGFRFRVVDALLTNFHLPRSTLLILVSTFAGHAPVMAAYALAVEEKFRFFSYGDAMWLERAVIDEPGV